MKIILMDDVPTLGRRGEVRDVSDGYARNFLLPQKLALHATAGEHEEPRADQGAARTRQAAKLRPDAESQAQAIEALHFAQRRQASDEGRLFGSVGTRRPRRVPRPSTGSRSSDAASGSTSRSRRLGEFSVPVRLHADVTAQLKVSVSPGIAVATLTDLLTSKIPPHSLEAERAVLGAILLERESLPKAIELLKPADFYKEGHRKIFDATLALFERNEPVDLLTVSEELKRRARAGRGRGGRRPREPGRGGDHRGPPPLLRGHRPREGPPARPHPHRHRDHRAELRGPGRRGQAARRRGAADLPDLRAAHAGRGLPGAGHPQGHLRAHREALRPQGAHHRARHRLRRPRPDDVGLPAERLHHHRGAPLDGQDRLRAEHRQVRRGRRTTSGCWC